MSRNSIPLQQQFANRHRDEIAQLLALQQAALVTFDGGIQTMSGSSWVVENLPLNVPPGTPGIESLTVGNQVEVQAVTTTQGRLIASSITLLIKDRLNSTPQLAQTVIPLTSTFTLTATVTVTVTPTMTGTLAPTRFRPTAGLKMVKPS